MEYNTLPKTDLKVSGLCLGTWVFGGDVWGGSKESESLDAVSAALDFGINFIDTAPIYGDGLSERIVGKAIKKKRQKVVLATKCGLMRREKQYGIDLGPMFIRKEVEDSLRRLQVETIDLYQCHWPDPNTPIEMTLETLCQIRREGKVRYMGVCNFELELLRQASTYTDVTTLQCQYSLLKRSVEEDDTLSYCQEQGIGFLAYGPLGGGILSGKYHAPKVFNSKDARSFFYPFYEEGQFEKTQKLLSKLQSFRKPLNEIALNWIRQQRGVSSVIVGCRNADQVRSNTRCLRWDLAETELEQIRSFHLESS